MPALIVSWRNTLRQNVARIPWRAVNLWLEPLPGSVASVVPVVPQPAISRLEI